MKTDLSLREILQLPPPDRCPPRDPKGISLRHVVTAISIVLAVAAMAYGVVWALYYVTAPIPNISGQSGDRAKTLLERAGYSMEVAGEEFSTLPLGFIVAQAQTAGSKSPLSKIVQVTASLGSQEIVVPDVIGDTLVRARSIILGSGLEVDVQYQPFDSEPEIVKNSKPAIGTRVKTGDAVTLIVSAKRSQVPLVEYNLDQQNIVIEPHFIKGLDTDVSRDIALRLSSLVQAASGKVKITRRLGEENISPELFRQRGKDANPDAQIILKGKSSSADSITIRGSYQDADAVPNSSLTYYVMKSFDKIPLAYSYKRVADSKLTERDKVITLAIPAAGREKKFESNLYRDNIARSIYMAIGQEIGKVVP